MLGARRRAVRGSRPQRQAALGIAVATIFALLSCATPARADFGPRFDVTTTSGHYQDAKVAVDAAGNTHFVWQYLPRNGIDAEVVQTRMRAPDGTLGPIQALSAPGRNANGPNVAVDGAGNAYFVWDDMPVDNKTRGGVWARRRSADGSFGPALRLSGPEHRSDSEGSVDLAVDAAGNVQFVWVFHLGTFPSFSAVQTRRLTAAGTLGPIETLSPASAGSSVSGAPVVAMAPDGHADFLWAQSNGPGTYMAVTRRRAAGGGLGPVATISAGRISGGVAAAADGAGNTHLAWAEVTDVIAVKTRMRAADGVLGATVDVGVGQNVDVDVDGDGSAFFTWRGDPSQLGWVVKARRRARGGALDAATDDIGIGTRPQVAVDAAGTAHYLWAGSQLQARSRSRAGVLSPVQNLGAAPGRFGLDVNAAGTAAAAWPGFDAVQAAVAQSPLAVVISGPSGLTASASARFEFVLTDPTPPAGQFECSVDTGAFTSCTSPLALTRLADGEHSVEIRYHVDGESPGGASVRRWTVDTTAPAVVFDSAPSGEGNAPDEQIVFHSTEPESTFTCRLDNGPELDCSSPHALFGLAADAHAFTVIAFDRAGNASAPAVVGWSVDSGALTPTTFSCAQGGGSVSFGPITVIARAADACFTKTTVDGQAVHASRGRVTLNGIGLVPAAGTQILVTPTLGDGRVRTDGPVTVEFGAGITRTYTSLDLDSLVTQSNFANRVLGLGTGFKIGGLDVEASAGLLFTADNGGQVTVTFRVKLPKVAFSELPGSPQDGVMVEFAPTLSNDKGLTVAGKIKVGQVFLFGRKVKDLELGFDSATGVFEGSLGIEFGPALRGVSPTLTGTIGLGLTSAACGLSKLGLQASNLNRHISDSWPLAGPPGTDENGAVRPVDVGSAWCQRARISVRRESLGHPELLP